MKKQTRTKKKKKLQKSQGSLEFLLLIGGAIVVAAIVVTLMLGVGDNFESQSRSSTYTLAVNRYIATNGVGYWKFNEGGGPAVADSSGNMLNGTKAGSVNWAEGKFSNALDFSSSGGGVTIPYSDNMNKPKTGITIAAWVKRTGNITDADVILSRSAGIYTYLYSFFVYQNKDYFIFTDRTSGTQKPCIRSPGYLPTATLNEWIFYAATYDGKESKIYADMDQDGKFTGAEIYSCSYPGFTIKSVTGVTSPSNLMYLGTRYGGSMDEMILLDRALTKSELEVLAKG